jgi:hypothetical protein
MSPTVSVIIPALNEEANLPLVLEGLPPVDEVIVVDGGSSDDTVAVAREVRPDAVVVRQTRTGKGNALVCGFEAATGDIVITLNGDGTTDPGEIPRYVDALLAGAEVAHGSRYRDGGGNLDEHRLDRFGNRTLNRFVNALFGTRFTDLGYGYNAYWRTLLPALDLPGAQVPGQRRGVQVWGDGPEIEPLINIRMAAQGLRVVEVASVGYPRIHGTGHRSPADICVRALRTTLTEYLRRWKIGRQTNPQDDARHDSGRQDRTPRSARHGSTGVGRGARRRAAPAEEPYGSFLPPEPESTGRHAAHRADSPYDDTAHGTGETPGRRHRYAEEDAPRQSGWTHTPNPRQEPPWSRRGETPPIDQRSWRDSYTDPDSVIPGDPRRRLGIGQPDDPRQSGERRTAPYRRGAAERRADQRWHSTDAGPTSPTRHLAAPFEPAAQRPDLTVIAGEGRAWQGDGYAGQPSRTAHLRAVPGERYGRPSHRA